MLDLYQQKKNIEMETDMSEIEWDVVSVSEAKQRGESLNKLKLGHLFY